MCLKIKSGPYVAKKDFYTLKIATGITKTHSVSPYQYFKYEFGKEQQSDFEILDNRVEKGLHSLLIDKVGGSSWVVGYFVWGDFLYCPSGLGLILCKIPKGSIYYLGEDQDIVSDNLIPIFPVITKEIDDKAIEDGEQVKCTYFREMAALAEKWVKNANYNIKAS